MVPLCPYWASVSYNETIIQEIIKDYISPIHNKGLDTLTVKRSIFERDIQPYHAWGNCISRIPVYKYLALIKTSMYIIVQYMLKVIVCLFCLFSIAVLLGGRSNRVV